MSGTKIFRTWIAGCSCNNKQVQRIQKIEYISRLMHVYAALCRWSSLHAICSHSQNVNDFPFSRGDWCCCALHEWVTTESVCINTGYLASLILEQWLKETNLHWKHGGCACTLWRHSSAGNRCSGLCQKLVLVVRTERNMLTFTLVLEAVQ